MTSFIPQSRTVLYIILFGLLFPLISIGYLFLKQQTIHELHSLLENIQSFALMNEKKQASNLSVREHFRENDRFYIDKHIESITLRESEIQALEKIANQQHITDNEAVKQRLDHLKHHNKLVFSEGVVQAHPYFQETMETLIQPVEIDEYDLKNIISKIEGIDIEPYNPGPHRPQLVITEMQLERKQIWGNSEELSLNLKLLKREFF